MSLAIPEFIEFDLALARLSGEKIAISEASKEGQALYLIGKNITTPGSFAVFLEQQVIKDTRGRNMPAMKAGDSLLLLHRIAFEHPDLLEGASNEAVAGYLDYDEYDERRKSYTRRVSEGVLRALGIEMGWSDNRFRILTARQVVAKADRLTNQTFGNMETVERWRKSVAIQGFRPNRNRPVKYTEMPLFDLPTLPELCGGADD